jgi:hypothetical protein
MKFLPLLLSLGLTSAALANDFELRYKSVDPLFPELELVVVSNGDSSFAEITRGYSALDFVFEHVLYSQKAINDSLDFVSEEVDDKYTNSVWNRNSGKVYWANSDGDAGVLLEGNTSFSLVDLIGHVRENGIDSEKYSVLTGGDFCDVSVSSEGVDTYKVGLREINIPFLDHGVLWDGDRGVGMTPSEGYLHMGIWILGVNIDFVKTD